MRPVPPTSKTSVFATELSGIVEHRRSAKGSGVEALGGVVVSAHIVDLWLHHKAYHSKVKTQTGAGKTPSAIKKVETVTKANIKSTVIKDGFVTKAELCTSAVPAADCAGL